MRRRNLFRLPSAGGGKFEQKRLVGGHIGHDSRQKTVILRRPAQIGDFKTGQGDKARQALRFGGEEA